MLDGSSQYWGGRGLLVKWILKWTFCEHLVNVSWISWLVQWMSRWIPRWISRWICEWIFREYFSKVQWIFREHVDWCSEYSRGAVNNFIGAVNNLQWIIQHIRVVKMHINRMTYSLQFIHCTYEFIHCIGGWSLNLFTAPGKISTKFFTKFFI